MNFACNSHFVAAAAVATFALSAQAITYTWTGQGVDSSFSTGGNWDGNVAPGATEENVDLVFPSTGANVTGLGTRKVNKIELQGGTVQLEFGASGGTFTVNGAISGPGGLVSVGSPSANSYVVLAAESTFSGGYFNDGGRTTARASNAFGTGPVKIKSNNKPGYSLLFDTTTTTHSNDFTIGLEGSTIGTLWASKPVTFKGKMAFTVAADMRPASYNNNFRISSNNSAALITFEGPVEMENTSSAFLPHTGYIKFASQIAKPMYIDFNGEGLIEFCQPSNNVTSASFNNWGGGNATYRISADDPFLDGATRIGYGKTYGDKRVNLNGHDTVVKAVYQHSSEAALGAREVTSATPAKLTIRNDDANSTFLGAYNGALSLDYDSPGRTYTLTNGVSTMTGTFRVSNGSVVQKDNAAMDAISSLEVNGSLTVAASAGAFGGRLKSAAIGEEGVLDLGGRTIKVDTLVVAGETKTKGVYTAADLPGRLVNGTVEVLLDGTEWTWTGSAGGVWSTPGNWSVGGQPATETPPAGAVLHIADATEATPFVVEGSATTISNPIILGWGQQVVRFTTNRGTLNLNGRITGKGGWRFTCQTGVATEKLYTVRFGNANNDFAGGVRRSDGGQLVLSNAYGTGRITVDTGSNNGSSTPNLTPLTCDVSPLTFTNDLFIGRESYQSWNGWWTGSRTVRLTGKVDFALGSTLNDQARFVGASPFTFDGPVSIGGRLICKSGASATFSKPIRKYTGDGVTNRPAALYADNESFTGRLAASSNEVTHLYFGQVNVWKWFFDAPDAIPLASIYLEGEKIPNNATFDLCGNDQHVADVYYAQSEMANVHAVHFTSDTAATLTISNTASRLFGGTFDGGVSVVYAGAKATDTHTLSGATHSTTGGLTVAKGTVVCTAGTRFAAISKAEANDGATLRLEDAQVLNRKSTVRLGNAAKLDLAFEGQQRVRDLFVGNVQMEPGIYGATDNPAATRHLETISGTGQLYVTGSGMTVVIR